MTLRWLFMCCLLVLSVGSVAAQPAPQPGWQVVIYDEIMTETFPEGRGKERLNAAAQVERTLTRQLHFIDAAGLRETVTLPALYGERDSDFFAYSVIMSPDLRYVVIESSTQTEQETFMSIVDLETMDVTFSRGTTRFHSNFQGTAFAASYQYAEYDWATDETRFDNGLMTVDVTTGAVTAEITLPEIIDALDADVDFEIEDLIIGSWQADGVHFLPSCRSCYSYHLPTYGMLGADVYAGLYYVWNPVDNTITRSADDYHLDFAETLTATGEILQLGPADGYNVPESSSYGVTRRNTVRYWPSDDAVLDDGRVVYAGAEDIDFGSAQWVLDGNAFLLRAPAAGVTTLVYRDGTVQTIESLHGGTIVGTPDGWLTISRQNGVYAYTAYTGVNGAVTAAEVMQFAETSPHAPLNTPLVAYTPALGAAAAPEPFPEF